MSATEASSYAVASLPLWVAPVVLVVGGALAAWVPRAASRNVRLATIGGAALALAPSVPVALGKTHVVSAASRLARVGSVDLALGFELDRVSVVGAVAVLLVAALVTWPRTAPEQRAPGLFVVTAGALVAVLADGLPAWLLGVGLAAAATTLFSDRPWVDVRAKLGAATAALAAITLGVAYLAWALGGQWLDGNRYFSDWGARFVVPREASASTTVPTLARDPHAMGSLTLVSHPGARVYLGVADEGGLARSEPLAISPFARAEVPAGLQKIVVVPGDAAIIGGEGLEAALIDAVPIAAGKETVIDVEGPSVTFREISAQVEPRKLELRRLGASRVATLVVGLVAVGLLFFALFVGRQRSRASGAERAGEAVALDALVALPVGVLIHRLASVLTAGEPALFVVAAVGVGFAARVAYETWIRPSDTADRARAPLAVALALAPALAATGLAFVAPAAIGVAALVVAFAARPASAPELVALAPAAAETLPESPPSPPGGVAKKSKKRSAR